MGRYRLLLIDLPGHGRAAAAPGPFGVAEFASWIGEAVREAEASGGVFWGTHLGAAAGLALAAGRPGLFSALVLEAPVFPGRAPPAVADVLSRVAETARRDGVAAARDVWWREGPWFDEMRADPKARRAAAQRAMIDRFEGAPWLDAGLAARPLPEFEAQLARLGAPMLVLTGEREIRDFVDAADALAAAAPHAERAVVPRGGGFPLWELPDVVNPIVAAWLDRIAV